MPPNYNSKISLSKRTHIPKLLKILFWIVIYCTAIVISFKIYRIGSAPIETIEEFNLVSGHWGAMLTGTTLFPLFCISLMSVTPEHFNYKIVHVYLKRGILITPILIIALPNLGFALFKLIENILPAIRQFLLSL